MKVITNRRYTIRPHIFLSIVVIVLACCLTPQLRLRSTSAFIDAELTTASADYLSVIITGTDMNKAIAAVNSVGGVIDSELWLINAVSASVTPNQVEQLATYPEVVSIINNYTLNTADGDSVIDKDSAGYVTNRLMNKGGFAHTEPQVASSTALPDGGFVSVDEKGGILIINADGSQRAQIKLNTGGHYGTTPQVSSDGTIFVVDKEKRVYAINADGSIRWVFGNARDKFLGSVLINSDETIIYIIDQTRNVYALTADDGQIVWQHQVERIDGDILSTPVLAEDGTLYVVSDKGYLAALDASGNIVWTYRSEDGGEFNLSPVLDSMGRVFITGENKTIGLDKNNGSLLVSFEPNSKIVAQPTISQDGTLFVADEGGVLTALDMDGSIRFTFQPASAKFMTSPTLSLDQQTVIIAEEENIVYGIDAENGLLKWEYVLSGKILHSPVVDSLGRIIVGADSGGVVFLSVEGQPVYQTAVSGSVSQAPIVDDKNNVMIQVGDRNVVMLGMLPDHWDGRPDVLPTDDKRVWQVVNPVAIDVGADQVHDGFEGAAPTLGEGITIAVVDTGAYFSQEVKTELGPEVTRSFIGQADFVDSTCSTFQVSKNKWRVVGTQYTDYCFTDHHASRDDYGHGSHVAGIIWNNFKDQSTGTTLGIAPKAQILSVRVLGPEGSGTYEDVIEGIQYVVENKEAFDIRIMNMSLSAPASVPYFVDPINRAVEAAWAEGIVVVAAAGNNGQNAQTISVPGNDPYVITVGSLNSNRTPGYWADDSLSSFSASGPTLDGFVKPDILAPGSNIVSFMYNDEDNVLNSAALVREHPDYAESSSLFRMNGTSMATAVTSGAVALMLDVNPDLTPDQVKFRLMYSAIPAITNEGELIYSPLQQGAGRIWVPDAVFGTFPEDAVANAGLDIHSDLAHGWALHDENGSLQFDSNGNPLLDDEQLQFHYQGSVRAVISDDDETVLYYMENLDDGTINVFGAARTSDFAWLDYEALTEANLAFNESGENGLPWQYADAFSSGSFAWSGGSFAWSGGSFAWSGGSFAWSGGSFAWSGGSFAWSGGSFAWSGADQFISSTINTNNWVEDEE